MYCQNGWKMLKKTFKCVSHLLIYMCFMVSVATALLPNEINELDISLNSSKNISHNRKSRWFPFYTIGRFINTPCIGSNQLMGTCVLVGECAAAGGVATGSCNAMTRQATCCVYQHSCGATTSNNNTYFVSPMYPELWSGGSACTLTVNPCSSAVCQLRVEFLDLSLVGPSGDGSCNIDAITITGGSTIPVLCGENSGQHVVVEFDAESPILITIAATSSVQYGRHWFIRVTQYNCDSEHRAPPGCLQYHLTSSGVVHSFNYSPSPNAQTNSIGVEGTRQIANLAYGICFKVISSCSITYGVISTDVYSFTITGDVGAVDPTLLSTSTLQEQTCITDYVIIPNPSQGGTLLTTGSDRFCGLGLATTTSNIQPYVLYVVTDSNENADIGNRGFALSFTQNQCPVI